MNVIQSIETRRSVKNYDPGHAMPEEDIARLMHLAKLAPSSFNMQNYRFLLVRDKELRQQIRDVAWGQAQVTDASLLVVMCADLSAHADDPQRYWSHAPQAVQDFLVPALTPFYEGNERLIRDEAIRSTGFAGMTLMLAARDMGYDSCPMIGFDAEAVAKLIHLPDHFALSFILAIGKGTTAAWPRGGRLADSETVFTDRFPQSA